MNKTIASVFTLIICAFLLNPSIVVGQHCQTSEKRAERILENPSIIDEIDAINTFTEKWVSQHQNMQSEITVSTLPVVVHVVWLANSENITDAQIMSQIDVLNADFRKLNSNFSSTYAPFQNVAADVEFEFCLASVDPNGNSTNGITRTQTTINEIGETNNFFSTANGGHDPWDNSKYINIWVCNQAPGSLGFATPPGTAMPAAADGVVIPSIYFGTIGTAAGSAPNHLGRTCTHEMGHYFNLEHVWGPTNGGCNEDDFVTDTPNQDTETFGCPTSPYTDNCTSGGNGINFQNYLDYSDDNCMTMFTEGQKSRMLAALNGPRSTLMGSNACGVPASLNESHDLINAMEVFPNPSMTTVTISINGRFSEQNLSWSVFDVLGKEHISFSMTKSKELNVRDLPAGVYYLSCNDISNVMKKIIVLK